MTGVRMSTTRREFLKGMTASAALAALGRLPAPQGRLWLGRETPYVKGDFSFTTGIGRGSPLLWDNCRVDLGVDLAQCEGENCAMAFGGINGRTVFVDPHHGSNHASGTSTSDAVRTLAQALNLSDPVEGADEWIILP